MTLQASVGADTGFDITPITATVNPAPATPRETVETGFAELDGTPAAVQQAAPTVDTLAHTGTPENPDAGLDARVATLLLKKPTTDRNAVQAFMAAVVPWPSSSNDAGWVNLHWSFPDKDSTAVPKANVVRGSKPFKNIADFMTDVAWRLQRPKGFKDMFFCTSMQREHKTDPNGKLRASKSRAAALALKSIWVDIDVKAGDPKHYHTEAEALKAILLFAKTVGLPEPSAVVRSGGGLHIYWISREVLSPQEWLPYAQGLKNLLLANNVFADTGLTTDAARILRVPGTLNHKPKYPRPMPVELAHSLPLAVYDFPKQLMFLQQFAGPTVAPTAAPDPHSIWADDPTVPPGARDRFKNGPAAAFAMLKGEPNLNAGINKHEGNLLKIAPIFEHCGFYKEALQTGGGTGHEPDKTPEPLWSLAILGTIFMENGREVAHAISKGDHRYTAEVANKKFDEKVAAGVGYPSCSQIAGAGCKSCATCPLLGKVKSPLNIRPDVTATVNDTGSQSGSSEQGPGSSSEITVNYIPGNEVACRTALDDVVAADLSTFTSGDILTILRVPEQDKPGLERWGGDLPGTTPALPADIIERAERLSWMAPTGGKGEQRWKRCKPPRDFCTDYITQRRGRYGARLLVGIARVPFIRDDGTIRVEPGYDPQTGIFVDRAPNLVVPDFPTIDDAKAALQRVMKPYAFYVFEDPVNGPLQVLAANLSALQRPYMKTAPMFVVNGVQAGTGKGQLCRAIGHLALATAPPFMSWGHDDDEFKKRFDTMLLASPAMLVMDNCNGRVLRGDTLEMILSEGEATIRQFNKLEAITVRSRTFLMANGNNIQISGDMSRRGIKINILPRSASPESDVFPFTPEDYVIEHRDALLSDYYTMMRAYRHAGMPHSGLPAVGSFSEWERKVRDLIFWLTGHDLSGDFKKNKLDDPEQQEDAAVLSALRVFFGDRWFKAAEADAALKRAAERRRLGVPVSFCAGPKTAAAMKLNNISTIDELVQAMEAGTVPVDNDVLKEVTDLREHEVRVKNEAALLEATEQKFGAKPEYAKTLGNWARGIQKKFVDGLILHRQDDPHTKIHRIKVATANSTAKE